MAWTAPRTYTVGELQTAAIFNTHIRDNLNYLKGNAGAVTISDELASIVAGGGTLTAQGTNNNSFARYKMIAKTVGGALIDWRFLANGAGTSEFAIFDSSSGSALERLRIDTSGNVGIGYTAPQGKLHLGGVGGGMAYLSATGVNGTLQTISGNFITRGAGMFVGDVSTSGGTDWAYGKIMSPQLNGTEDYTTADGDVIRVGVNAAGAVTLQRITGTFTHQINILCCYF